MLKRARRRFWVICHWLWAWDFSFLLLSWLSWCRDSTRGDLLKHNYWLWRHPAQGHSAVLSNNNNQDDSGYHFNCLHTTAIIRSFMFPLFIKKKTPLKKKDSLFRLSFGLPWLPLPARWQNLLICIHYLPTTSSPGPSHNKPRNSYCIITSTKVQNSIQQPTF